MTVSIASPLFSIAGLATVQEKPTRLCGSVQHAPGPDSAVEKQAVKGSKERHRAARQPGSARADGLGIRRAFGARVLAGDRPGPARLRLGPGKDIAKRNCTEVGAAGRSSLRTPQASEHSGAARGGYRLTDRGRGKRRGLWLHTLSVVPREDGATHLARADAVLTVLFAREPEKCGDCDDGRGKVDKAHGSKPRRLGYCASRAPRSRGVFPLATVAE